MDYYGLNNKPFIQYDLQPNNLYSSSRGNLGIGITTTTTEKLHVLGNIKTSGNLITDTNLKTTGTSILTGNVSVGSSTNTSSVISGSSRVTNEGNIQYVAVGTGGSHIFYTSSPITTRMTISRTGVNINDNLAMTGRTGFGTSPHVTYRVDVNGTLNDTSLLVGGVVLVQEGGVMVLYLLIHFIILVMSGLEHQLFQVMMVMLRLLYLMLYFC